VSTQPRTRIESHQAVGFGRAGMDDLPHIDVELIANGLKLVYQSDVDARKYVLE
jgi:hypothetical protein